MTRNRRPAPRPHTPASVPADRDGTDTFLFRYSEGRSITLPALSTLTVGVVADFEDALRGESGSAILRAVQAMAPDAVTRNAIRDLRNGEFTRLIKAIGRQGDAPKR